MSKAMMITLIIQFAVIFFDSAIKGQHVLAFYGLGGMIINISIFKMNF